MHCPWAWFSLEAKSSSSSEFLWFCFPLLSHKSCAFWPHVRTHPECKPTCDFPWYTTVCLPVRPLVSAVENNPEKFWPESRFVLEPKHHKIRASEDHTIRGSCQPVALSAMCRSLTDLRLSQRPWNQYLLSNLKSNIQHYLESSPSLENSSTELNAGADAGGIQVQTKGNSNWEDNLHWFSHTMKGFTPMQNTLTGKGSLLCTLKVLTPFP